MMHVLAGRPSEEGKREDPMMKLVSRRIGSGGTGKGSKNQKNLV
jgi:hypothetical protein